jgi:branched-chain amino acid transport system permease protein
MGALPALIIGLSIMPFFAREYVVEVAILFFIYIILAQSYRLVTTTHDWTLCHVVLFGVGAYTSGLLAKYFGIPVWVCIPIGGVMAALVGAGVIQPLLRTVGFGFFIASYALGELIRLVWVKVHTPFGGPRGIINIPYPPVVAGIDFSNPIPYYFMCLVAMLVCLYLMYRVDKSRIGDAFKSISIHPLLAESIGISVPKYRTLAMTIGAFFAGIAGGLLVHRLGAVDPRVFDIITMVYLVIWVVVGGTGTFWGPIIGVVVMQAIFEFTRPFLEMRPMFFGIILILFLVFLPGGIESVIAKVMARFRARRRVVAKTG